MPPKRSQQRRRQNAKAAAARKEVETKAQKEVDAEDLADDVPLAGMPSFGDKVSRSEGECS